MNQKILKSLLPFAGKTCAVFHIHQSLGHSHRHDRIVSDIAAFAVVEKHYFIVILTVVEFIYGSADVSYYRSEHIITSYAFIFILRVYLITYARAFFLPPGED
jgi:hypothetical protein